MADPNVIALILGAASTAFAGYLATRTIKRGDARAEAEAALIGIGPKIIEQQNARIETLTKQMEALWDREHECQRELAFAKNRIEILERKVGDGNDNYRSEC